MVVACGGSTTSIPDGTSSGGGGTSGSNGGTTSSSSSSSSSGGTSGGGTCTQSVVNGDRACVPGTAKANAEIEIEVDASDGCLGCFTTLDPCEVSVSGKAITIQMRARTCPPPGDQACPAVCMQAKSTCKIPPLAAGTYSVAVVGDKPGTRPRELVVTNKADAATSSCKLPPQGATPDPLNGEKFSRSCSVPGDCALATVGNVCQPCSCPNTAISKSSVESYQSEYRARTSQCPNTQGGPICAACPPMKADCDIDPTALTGTCKMVQGF